MRTPGPAEVQGEDVERPSQVGGMGSRVGTDQLPVDVDGLPGHGEGLLQLPGRVQVDGEDV